MIKLKNKKILVVAMFLLAVVSISIGYAFFTRTLNINGNASIAKNTWDIHFNDINERCYSISAETPAYIVDNEKTQIDFKVNLTKPGQIYSFDADIVNAGSIDAMIESATLSGIPEDIKDTIIWDVTYLNGDKLQPCDELLHETTRKIRVVVQYKDLDDEEELIGGQELNLSLVVKYVQSDSSICTLKPAGADPVDDPVCAERMLTIDPNGGTYDGKTENTIIAMKPFSTYEMLIPEREEFEFTGWTVSETEVYKNNIVTMGENNITMTANWKAVVHTHNLTINPNGGTYDGKTENTVYEMIAEETKEILVPSRDGYRFLGWNITPESVELNSENVIVMGDEDITLVADWEEIPSYTLTINPNGGIYNGKSEPTVLEFGENDEYSLLEATYDGYDFVVWKAIKDGMSEEVDLPSDLIEEYSSDDNKIIIGTKNITLTADWLKQDLGDDVCRIEQDYYPTIQECFDASENNDDKGSRFVNETIHMLKSTNEISQNNNDHDRLTLNLEGFTVTGKMTNNTDSDLTLINGSLVNNDGVAFVNKQGATLTLTDNDDVRVKVDDSVNITGVDVALEQKGTFNFYDGYLKATEGLDGKADDLPVEHIVFVDQIEEDLQKVYPALVTDRAIAKTTVDDVEYRFVNLQTAFDHAMKYEVTVYPVRDFVTPYDLHVDAGKVVTFDTSDSGDGVNHKKWSISAGGDFTNNGTFNLIGNWTFGGEFTNNGTFNLEKSKFVSSAYDSSDPNPVNMNDSQGSILNNGTLKLYNSQIPGNLFNNSNEEIVCITEYSSSSSIGTITNNDGVNVKVSDCGVNIVKNNGTYTMNGGHMYGDTYVHHHNIAVINDGGTFILDGGEISVFGNGNVSYNVTGISGGTFIMNSGKVSTSGFESNAVMNANVTLNDGLISSSGGYQATTYGIHNGSIEMNGGTIEASSVGSDYVYGINGTSGTINGGTINVSFGSDSSYGSDTKAVGILSTRNIEINDITMTSTHTCLVGNEKVNGGAFNCGRIGIYSNGAIVNGGTINSVLNGVSGRNAYLYGGTIKSSESDGVNVNEFTIGVLGTDGPLIEGANNGAVLVSNSNSGSHLFSGTIIGNNGYGVLSNSGYLIVGGSESEINIINPLIVGTTYGLYKNDGQVSFLGGILKGQTGSYFEEIDSIPNGTTLVKENETVDEIELNISYLISQDNFAKVGDEEFNSLKDAIDAIEDVGTIEIIKSVTVSSYATIPSGKNVTIDFKGNKLKYTNKILNNGTLRLTDSTNSGNLNVESVGQYFVDNRGILEIVSGYYRTQNILIKDSNEFTMTGGIIEKIGSSDVSSNTLVLGDGSSVITINGGSVNNYNVGANLNYGIYSANKIVVNDGNIESLSDNNSNSLIYGNNVEVNGGNISLRNGNMPAIYALSVLDITSGNIISNEGYSVDSRGNLDISGGTFTSSSYCVNVAGTGNEPSTISGGTFNCEDDALIVSNNLNITGGNITSTNGNGLNIDKNGITVNVGNAIISGNNAGIVSNSVVNIGSDDGEVNSSYPVIIGKSKGVISTGTLNLYDGILKGKVASYDGLIYGIAESYTLKNGTEVIDGDNYLTTTLEVLGDFIRVGSNTYNNFADAIAAITDSGTMELIGSAPVSIDVDFPSDKNIILDLNGQNLRMTKQFIVNGNLTIKDSGINGEIVSFADAPIDNNGTLTINSGNYRGVGKLITNSGTVNLNNGKYIVSSNDMLPAIVYNDGSAILNVTGGNYQVDYTGTDKIAYGFYGGTINVDSSTVTVSTSGESAYGIYASLDLTATNSELNISSSLDDSAVVGIQGLNTVNLDNVSISSDNCVISSNSNAVVANSTMNCANNGITSTASILTSTNNTINAGGNAVNVTKGNANIVSGEYKSQTSAIYASFSNYDSGSLLIGTAGELNKENPVIVGNNYGVYIDFGTAKMFDGIVKGQIDAVYGAFTNIEDGTYIYKASEMIDESEYQVIHLEDTGYVYENVNTSEKYTNLQDAVAAASVRDTIKLLDDVQIYYDVTLDNDDDIVIDLDGYDMKLYRTINNKGQLTYKNGNTENKSSLLGYLRYYLFDNTGILTVNDVDITFEGNQWYSILNKGELNLNGVSLTSSYGGINTFGDSVININDSTISAQYCALDDVGESHIAGSNISGGTYGVYYENGNASSITDSTISSSSSSVYKYSGEGNVIVSNSVINNGQINNRGNLQIESSEIHVPINNNGESLYLVSNVINSPSDGTDDFVVLKSSGGDLSLTENSFEAETDSCYNYCFKYSYIKATSGQVTANKNEFKNRVGYVYVINGDSTLNASYDIIDDSYVAYDIASLAEHTITNANVNSSKLFNAAGTINYSDSDATGDTSISGEFNSLRNNYNGSISFSGSEANFEYDTILGKISSSGNGTLNIKNTTINVVYSSSGELSGIHNKNSTINFIDSSVSVETTSSEYSLVYGIYINGGTVNFGEQGNVVKDIPSISAKVNNGIAYGVKKESGYFNYYDGLIATTSTTTTSNYYSKPLPESPNAIDDGYEATLYYNGETNTYYTVLENVNVENNFVVEDADGNKYTSLQLAVNSTSKTVKLLTNLTEDVVINQGSTINLNGLTLNGQVVVRSSLAIVNGDLVNNNGYALINYGAVNLNPVRTIGEADSLVIRGSSYGIYNEGDITMLAGTIAGINGAIFGDTTITTVNGLIAGGSEIVFDNVTYKAIILGSGSDYIRVGEKTYNNLGLAFYEAGENDTTFEFINTGGYINSSYLTVPEGTEWVLDLNGNNITSTAPISVYGKLTIKDSSEEKLGVLKGTKFYVYGELNLESGTLQTFQQNDLIYADNGSKVSIDNSKIVLKYGGQAITTRSDLLKITNTEFIINVTGGTAIYPNGELQMDNVNFNINSPGEYTAIAPQAKATISNVNINGVGLVAGIRHSGYNDDLNLTNINIDIDGNNTSANSLNGIYSYGNVPTLNNVNVKIYNFQHLSAQGVHCEGIYGADFVYNGGKIEIDVIEGDVYGIYSTKKTMINDVDVDVNVTNAGNNSVYGINANISNPGHSFENVDVSVIGKSSYMKGMMVEGNATYTDVTIDVNNSGGQAYGIYGNKGSNMVDSEVNVVIDSPTYKSSSYGIYNGSNELSLENVNVYFESNTQGGDYGIYSYGPLSVNSLTETMKKVTSSSNSYSYGIYSYGQANVDELDLDVQVTGVFSMYGVYLYAGGTISNSPINVSYDITGGAIGYGLYKANNSELVVDNVDVIVTATGATSLYGAYITNATISNSLFKTVNAGTNTLYAFTGTNVNLIDTDVYVEGENVPVPKYGYSLSGTSTINGGTVTVTGGTNESSDYMTMLYGISNTGTATISNLMIDSKYSCVNAAGTSMELNNVTMSCGDSGIRQSANLILNNVDINAGGQYGVYSTGGNLDVIDGGIKGKTLGVNYTVKDGIINIGSKDGNVIKKPLIMGNQIGVNIGGTVAEANYYDGIIKGGIASIAGLITEYEDNSVRIDETETIDDTVYSVTRLV